MSITRWLSERLSLSSRTSRSAAKKRTRTARPTFRPTLEALEHRWVPSTLTVTSAANSGAGSLRADIAAAHKGDTIVFAPSLDGQTITLTSGELLLNKNLTIAGPGAGELTISGNNVSRVFEIAARETVTLSGLTISNGQSAQGGGGVYVDGGGTLRVANSMVSSNTAHYSAGGGIENDGTLTVSGSTLTGNSVTGNGGGIYNHGTLTVNGGSILSGNSSTGKGGCICNYGTLTVNGGSILSDNTAGGGGGIENRGTATVTDSTLSGNSARSGGGGIEVSFGMVTVGGSILTDNVSVYFNGGGIYVSSGCTFTVTNSTLSGNSAYDHGGGIYNASGGTVTVENSSNISGNTAPAGYGADVYNLGVLYVDSSSTVGILDGNPAVPV